MTNPNSTKSCPSAPMSVSKSLSILASVCFAALVIVFFYPTQPFLWRVGFVALSVHTFDFLIALAKDLKIFDFLGTLAKALKLW
jgi:hypothetical protein